MGKLITRARQLRYEYQAKQGRKVTVEEVARAVGIDRKQLTRIELGQMERYDADVMERIADFYHKAGIDARHILEYNPEAIQSPGLRLQFDAVP